MSGRGCLPQWNEVKSVGLLKKADRTSVAAGEDPQSAVDLWGLYLASPQFMYR
jgi:hypothetical protein